MNVSSSVLTAPLSARRWANEAPRRESSGCAHAGVATALPTVRIRRVPLVWQLAAFEQHVGARTTGQPHTLPKSCPSGALSRAGPMDAAASGIYDFRHGCPGQATKMACFWTVEIPASHLCAWALRSTVRSRPWTRYTTLSADSMRHCTTSASCCFLLASNGSCGP